MKIILNKMKLGHLPCDSKSLLVLKQGFTLIELLVALAVLSILLLVAIPSFQTMILNNRLKTSSDLLVNGLAYAKSTALSNNSNVLICPFQTANSTTCGGDWSDGWIVLSQPAGSTPVLLKSEQNGLFKPTIIATNTSVTFNARGLASNQTNFSLCDSRGGNFARSVEVMMTGYIQSGSVMGQAVWNNTALTCP